ncbi:endonuclease V [Actinomadura kijaniata]|uniref:Endonuclease V n=1 Tax=Actinomadura namibiensis TaxID=182080 RepID=A0A7W3LK18_ACTNM|nr:deoxyribonuclease V [Actinomadura namibiensis]MBA8949517.1 deoxyribonuclease V [Actinomadura namibiensis]
MEVRDLHEWPATVAEAEAIQDRLRPSLDLEEPGPQALRTVAGLDVSYAGDGGGTGARLAAAVVVLDARTLEVVEESVVTGTAAFPYVPGLFAFRELPTLVAALRRLTVTPDLLVCDGYGVAHPRRFGLACHLGVLTGLPTIGVAKTGFVGSHETPGARRGDAGPLVDGGEVVGRVLRTRDGVKPVFVSVGHRIDLDTACRHVLALAPDYRLPETTRRADRLSRDALAASP